MTADLACAWGPVIDDYKLYDVNETAGYSIETTSPLPPGGGYAIKAVDPAASSAAILKGPTWGLPAPGLSGMAYTWAIMEDFRADGTFDDDPLTIFGIFAFWAHTFPVGDRPGYLRGIGQADGSYKVAIWDSTTSQIGISTSTYESGDWISIRIQYDGSNCKIWINGSLEITVATLMKLTDGRVYLNYHATDMATVTKYWAGYAVVASSSESDRPGTNLGRHLLPPDGDVAGGTMGDENDCTTTDGNWQSWDDWASGANDANTTYNCAQAGTYSETSTLDTATVSDDILGVVFHVMVRAVQPNKIAAETAVLRYDGNNDLISLDAIGVATYVPNSTVFRDVPGDDPWSQTVINGLAAGIGTGAGNNTAMTFTAMAVVVFTVDSDPPPAVTFVPRVMIF